MFIIVILLYYFILVHSRDLNKAILISSSIGYYNYRQSANILKIYHHLKALNYEDEDILLMIPSNIGCCQKNSIPGVVSFYDNDYTNLNSNIEIDFKYSEMKLSNVFNILRNKYDPNVLNKQRLQLNQKVNLLVYITGHGGDYYFKIRQRQALLQQHLTRIYDQLQQKKYYKTTFSLSDSCSAITIFQSVESQNFIALGSSSLDQKSQSHGYDSMMNIAKSDDFTFYVDSFLNENDMNHSNVTITNLYQYLDFKKLNVHSKLVSTIKNDKVKKLSLSTYFKKDAKKKLQTVKYSSINQLFKISQMMKL